MKDCDARARMAYTVFTKLYSMLCSFGVLASSRVANQKPILEQDDGPEVKARESCLRRQFPSFLSGAILVFFFLPWIQGIFEIRFSAFDLFKQGEAWKLGWLIPASSIVTLCVGMIKKREKYLEMLTGTLPLMLLLYASYAEGIQILRLLDFGAYLSVIFGCMLVLIPGRKKSSKRGCAK